MNAPSLSIAKKRRLATSLALPILLASGATPGRADDVSADTSTEKVTAETELSATQGRVLLAQADVSNPVPSTAIPGATSGTLTPDATAPANTGAAGGSPTGGPPGGGPPPVPVLLGIADFLIAIDRPFEAEGIYQGILAHDAENAGAKAGLANAKLAQQSTFTVLAHTYRDTHDVKLFTYGGGPTFRTKYGNITITAGTGHYQNDNKANNSKNPLAPIAGAIDDERLRKSTLNLLLEPHINKYEGRFFLSRVTYNNAPDRTLYDAKVSLVRQPSREIYSFTVARRDSILQSAQSEFFAPETYYTVKNGLTLNEVGGAVQYPIQPRIDLGASYSHFNYSDGNKRDTFKASLMYRIKPTPPQQMPVFRVGLGYTADDTKNFVPLYYSPQSIQSLSAVADYVFVRRNFKYGIFAGYPITEDEGSGFAKHKPAKTLFGFVNKQITDRFELYATGGVIRSPGFDLNFNDFVVGLNTRF